jgi:hypothetical protein
MRPGWQTPDRRQAKAALVYGGGVNFDATSHFGVRAEYRGFVYKAPDFKLDSLNLDKVTHLAQPSAGIYFGSNPPAARPPHIGAERRALPAKDNRDSYRGLRRIMSAP